MVGRRKCFIISWAASTGPLPKPASFSTILAISMARPLTAAMSMAMEPCLNLHPDSRGEWTERIIYSFPSYGSVGQDPTADLVFDAQGSLYGTTSTAAMREVALPMTVVVQCSS